jgi:hypothetical protein
MRILSSIYSPVYVSRHLVHVSLHTSAAVFPALRRDCTHVLGAASSLYLIPIAFSHVATLLTCGPSSDFCSNSSHPMLQLPMLPSTVYADAEIPSPAEPVFGRCAH